MIRVLVEGVADLGCIHTLHYDIFRRYAEEERAAWAMEDVIGLCEDALERFKLEAFDNVDVARLKCSRPEDARWIAIHLMSNATSASTYKAGQRILAALALVHAG